MFADKDQPSRSLIGRTLDMSPKMMNKLIQRIKRNGTLVPKKRGKQRKVTPEMVEFLTQWFKTDSNVGKSFKYAYGALVKESGLFRVGSDPVSMHGCYKAFRRYSDYTYKRIQRIKVKSNTESNKMKRV